MLGPLIKVIRKWSNYHSKSEQQHLEISELKWAGMGKFNSDDHCIYHCGQESLRKNGVALTAN